MAAEDDDSANFSDYDERKTSINSMVSRWMGKERRTSWYKEVFDARIMPGDNEKLGLLTSFQSMRERALFVMWLFCVRVLCSRPTA